MREGIGASETNAEASKYVETERTVFQIRLFAVRLWVNLRPQAILHGCVELGGCVS